MVLKEEKNYVKMPLRGMKKSDLQRLASQLNIDSDGLKVDLETRIIRHLLENERSLSRNPDFSSYYTEILLDPRYHANGTKNSSRKKSVVIQKTLLKQSLPVDNQSNFSNQKFKNHMNTPSLNQEKDQSDVDAVVNTISDIPSETVLSDMICISDFVDNSTLNDTFNHGAHRCILLNRLFNMRKHLSRVLVVDFLFCVYEFYNLLKFLIPWTYGIFLPDISVIFSFENFWSPFLTWWVLVIFIPLLAAIIFNFHESEKGRNSKIIDPMTFAVVKAIMVYFIFYKGSRKNMFLVDSIFVIKHAVGVELMFIISFIGVLYAMYDTSISRR